jgi:hypothetical protein
MSKRLYPLGQQYFPEIILENKVYVDKTMFALRLATTGKYYFLSRPRRFGKSLFISTLETLFLGKKEFFKGLYLYDKWQFEAYPIIKISFSSIGYRTMGLTPAISKALLDIAKSHNIEISVEPDKIDKVFEELIEKLHSQHEKGVVVLIDEYDKPLIDYLDKDNLHKAKENRDVLKSFYSILKDADPHLKMVFITGVSKFSKVSIFSDLNNLTDLSLSPDFNEICGISQQELEENFSEELTLYDKEEIRKWYNGYKFHVRGKTLYNPFSLLNFFNTGDFQNFWYTTGTPTFLMKLCREQHLYEFDEINLNYSDLGNFDIENLKIIPVLFQTGYLTLVGEDPIFRNAKLSFPNTEVRESYLRNLADAYIDSPSLSAASILPDLLQSLQTRNQDLMQKTINSAFANIPYDLWQRENEQYYHAIVHLLFSLLNVYIFSEVHTQNGRADAVIIHDKQIYCLEFKLNQSAEIALAQIKSRGYTERFQDKGFPIHHVGINFSSDTKKVDGILFD